MANVALIFSGQYVKYVSGLRSGLPIGTVCAAVYVLGSGVVCIPVSTSVLGVCIVVELGHMQTLISIAASWMISS